MKPMHATTPKTNPNTKVLTPGVIATPPEAIAAPFTTTRLATRARGETLPAFVLHDRCQLSKLRRRVSLLALLAVVAACHPSVQRVEPTPAGPAPLLVAAEHHPPLLDDGDAAGLAAAIRASAAYYARLPPAHPVDFGGERVPAARMRAALDDLARLVDTGPDDDTLARELDRRFRVYRAAPPSGVLYTGYYLPTLDARPARDARFRYPVLGRPSDLVTAAPGELGADCAPRTSVVGRIERGRLVPYATRAEIETAGVPGAPVLAWVDDPVALFFLQIQGTGRLAFPDGTQRLVGFAASNGHPYTSVGKLLVAEGHLGLDEASMQGIRRWIAAHPDERERILHANARYVFFRPLTTAPLGSLGVPVTGGRTIATDPAVYPPGALAFVRVPAASPYPTDALSRVVLNQDAGAAIRGPGRVDVFFGDAPDADVLAGRLRSPGELYFLAPRTGAE